MINRTRQVSLEEAAAGMVLAAEVSDRQGNVLLAQGAELSDTLLRALERRGVETIRIEDGGLSAEELAALREQAAQRLAHLFRNQHGGAADVMLREQLTAWRMEQLQ